MRRWLAAAGLVLFGACGGGGAEEAQDASVPDTLWEYPYCIRPAQRDEEPDDLERCGICVMPHERVINPHGISVWERATAAAIPAGLVVVDLYYGPYVSLITTEGQVVLLGEEPLDPEPYTDELIFGNSKVPHIVPVPGTNRFWVDSGMTQSMLSAGIGEERQMRNDVVLYEYDSEEGFSRLGSTYFDVYTHRRTAFVGGELVAWRTLDKVLMRVRALEDGTVEIVEKKLIASEMPLAPDAGITALWPLPSGNVALVGRNWQRSESDVLARESYVGVLDADLEVVIPWQLVGAEAFDPLYEAGLNPHSGAFAIANFPDGRAFLLAEGTVAGMGAAPWQHRFGTWIDADGLVEQEPPGIFINPDEFLRSVEITNEPIRTGIAVPLPTGRAGAIWDEWGLGGQGQRYTHGQVLEPEGTVVLEETLKFPTIDARAFKLFWTQDGAGNAYLRGGALRRIGPDLEEMWSMTLPPCPTAHIVDRVPIIFGASDEGVWGFWNDSVIEEASGLPVRVGKVTLIRPDGTFAWTE
jgi:hypothetical protein